jgi:hypothetical protein
MTEQSSGQEDQPAYIDPVTGQPLFIDPLTGQIAYTDPALASPPAAFTLPAYPDYPAYPGYPGYPPTAVDPSANPADQVLPGSYPPAGYPAGSYPPPGYPPAYPAPYGYGYPMLITGPRNNSLATASMVVSIVGCVLLLCDGIGGIAGLVGAILGHVARRQIKQRGEAGDGMALAGIIIGWIAAGITLIGVIVVAVVIYNSN